MVRIDEKKFFEIYQSSKEYSLLNLIDKINESFETLESRIHKLEKDMYTDKKSNPEMIPKEWLKDLLIYRESTINSNEWFLIHDKSHRLIQDLLKKAGMI